MVFNDETEVIDFIKKNSTPQRWVTLARENHKVLNALVTGKDFHEILIERIEKIESVDRALARKRYSKDIRDLFSRVLQQRDSIFSSHGGSIENTISSDSLKEKLIESLKHFKGQKSIKKYLSENFFRLADTDPNGLLFVEYKDDEDIYPTYKCINDIRYYKSDGQLCDVLLFEPINKKDSIGNYQEWRVVDDNVDYRIKQRNTSFVIDEELTFEHPFGKVPATILSDIQVMGSELRVSALFPIEELSKDYARDKSIKTIYKFQHGFPRHWRYDAKCRPCQGTGKTGEESCTHCSGTGSLRRNDITDTTTIDFPREDDPIVTPNLEGFISPDLATWEQFTKELIEQEDRISSTMWGTERIKEGQNETATGRFIDVQPVMNKLDVFTDNVEWVHNQLIKFVENWTFGQSKEENEYYVIYGRRFIIESPDVILDKYTEARTKGDNSTILDKLLDEFILSKYQNNAILLEQMQKKRLVEPYVHNSIKDVSVIFGSVEANKKVLFVPFWNNEADTNKDVKQLQTDFEAYFTANSKVVERDIRISELNNN